MLHAALMGSHQPSFEQRGNVVNAGHDHVGRIGATADDGDFDAGSPTSAGERSRSNRQCGWSIRARRWPERRGSGCPPIRRRRGADGCGQCHDRFSLPPRRQRPCPRSDVRACPLPGRRRKSRRSRSHRRGNRGQGGPSPGAVYAARSRPSRSCPDRAPRWRPSALTPFFWLVTNHMARNHSRNGLRVSLQHRSGGQRYLPIAGSTAQQAARHSPRLAHGRAVGADKAIRPAKPPDILTARRFAAKPRVELLKRPRVINPSDRMSPSDGMSRAFHPSTLSLVSTCVKGIPI